MSLSWVRESQLVCHKITQVCLSGIHFVRRTSRWQRRRESTWFDYSHICAHAFCTHTHTRTHQTFALWSQFCVLLPSSLLLRQLFSGHILTSTHTHKPTPSRRRIAVCARRTWRAYELNFFISHLFAPSVAVRLCGGRGMRHLRCSSCCWAYKSLRFVTVIVTLCIQRVHAWTRINADP